MDFNEDKTVNSVDLVILLSLWGMYCEDFCVVCSADEIERLQIEINEIRDNKYLWWVRDNWQGGVIQTNVAVTYEFLKDLEDAVGDGLIDMIGTKVAEEIRVEWRKHYER